MRLVIRLVVALMLILVGLQLLYALWPVLLIIGVLWVIYSLAR